ncbi:hypothetical protein ABH926_002226 [Catenulispora sp. GP43]|uniref:hypothetical protein n=1 Tax=Catenulispora sp. GP43 TaxID=3156263 RepID=UPI003512742C
MFQTTVTRDAPTESFHFQPRLTVCGTACAAGARYVIRGNATSAALVDTLDRVVMAWARGVSFGVPINGVPRGAAELVTTGPTTAFHPGAAPLPPLV